VTTEFSEKAKK